MAFVSLPPPCDSFQPFYDREMSNVQCLLCIFCFFKLSFSLFYILKVHKYVNLKICVLEFEGMLTKSVLPLPEDIFFLAESIKKLSQT